MLACLYFGFYWNSHLEIRTGTYNGRQRMPFLCVSANASVTTFLLFHRLYCALSLLGEEGREGEGDGRRPQKPSNKRAGREGSEKGPDKGRMVYCNLRISDFEIQPKKKAWPSRLSVGSGH